MSARMLVSGMVIASALCATLGCAQPHPPSSQTTPPPEASPSPTLGDTPPALEATEPTGGDAQPPNIHPREAPADMGTDEACARIFSPKVLSALSGAQDTSAVAVTSESGTQCMASGPGTLLEAPLIVSMVIPNDDQSMAQTYGALTSARSESPEDNLTITYEPTPLSNIGQSATLITKTIKGGKMATSYLIYLIAFDAAYEVSAQGPASAGFLEKAARAVAPNLRHTNQ